MIRKQTIFLIALAGGLCVAALVLLWRASLSLETPGSASQTGTVEIGGPFALIDQNGKARTDRDFRGHFMLLYFGYTFCPDVCPTTLQEMADALKKVGTRAQSVVPVFITVDPARDRPAVLKTYLSAFGPGFVGLTGSPDAIARVAHLYRVYFAKEKIAGGYAVDHSSVIYLMGPDGRFVAYFDAQENADTIAKNLASKLP